MTRDELDEELSYLRTRIADVEAFARITPNLAARRAYEELSRLYRDKIEWLSVDRETGGHETHFPSEGESR